MQVVANSMVLRYLKKIDTFKLDLGSNFKGPVMNKPDPQITFKIKDEFIKKYQSITNKLIHKYGEIGKLKFYEDLSLKNNELHVYNEENIYEIDMSEDDFKRDAKDYLGDVIKAIDGGVAETDEDIKKREEYTAKKEKIFTNMPEEIERPDMSLPKEQYLEELAERRRKLNEM